MTFLEAINSVLRRLREDEVTASNSTTYSKLIGDFINQSIYDVEHAWDWNSLKEVITITTVASQADYDFHTADVHILDVINDNNDWRLRVVPDRQQFSEDYLITPSTGSPYYYSFRGKNGNYSQIRLQPIPDSAESIRFLCIKHTPEYSIDSTDDAEVITCPSLPIVLSAYARAVSERGEDGGLGVNEANREASSALADAIALDAGTNPTSKVSWYAI